MRVLSLQLVLRSIVITVFLCAVNAFTQTGCGLQVSRYGEYRVWRNDALLIFQSGMTIDADGSPRAYHPDGVSGLDDLSNAGEPGHWDALATIDGEPVLQGPGDPAPSYFVSTTSLEDRTYPHTSPSHYINAEDIPYIALPPDLDGPELGNLAYVFSTSSGKASAAIFADESPSGKLGEGSIELARRISVNPDARRGGAGQGIFFVIFLGSGRHAPMPLPDIESSSKTLWNLSRLDQVLACVAGQ